MRLKVLIMMVAAVAVVALLSSSALGQCSMCRTALAGSNNALFIRNFNIGVLVLLVPPVTIFCSIFIALKRFRNESRVQNTGSLEDVDESDFPKNSG